MTTQTVKPYPKWLYSLDTVDSTNNYANKLIEDGLAHHGDVVWALEQTAGKGQRGKQWEAKAGENIMMTLMVQPRGLLFTNPFHLNMIVAHTLGSYFHQLHKYWKVQIKWPNDIYINAKKTAGVLVENIYRGSQWSFAIIGIGINVNQAQFPPHLNNATSLQQSSGLRFELLELITDIRAGILNAVQQYTPALFENTWRSYNDFLFAKAEVMQFRLADDAEVFSAQVVEVDPNGLLLLQTSEGVLKCASGSLQWIL